MRVAFALLLCGSPLCFFPLGSTNVAAIPLRAAVFRGAGLLQSDRDRLTPAVDLAAFATAATLQLAVFCGV
jgi:hypothetical protein